MSDSQPAPSVEPTVRAGRTRWRSVAAAVCVVLAALLTVPAGIAFWGQRTLNDGQRYLATVGPLVDSPQVQEAISTKAIDAIEAQVDIEAILNNAFAGVITDRPRLQQLVGPLAGAVDGLIEREVREFVASDAFADIWVRVNTRAQQGLVRVLKGDTSGAVSVQGEQVVLDVSDVIDQVKQRLVARGLTVVQNIPIPDTDKQIVLLDAPQLKQAQTIYAFANPLARWLIIVVAALYLAAFLLARRRPRMTVTIGVLLAANALLVAFCLSVGRQLFIDKLANSDFGPASAIFYDTLLTYLERGWKVLLWLGLILVVDRLVHRTQRHRHRHPHHHLRRTAEHRRRGRPRTSRRTRRRRRPLGRRQRPLAPDRHRPARRRHPALGQQPDRLPTALVTGTRDRAPGPAEDPHRRRSAAAPRPAPAGDTANDPKHRVAETVAPGGGRDSPDPSPIPPRRGSPVHAICRMRRLGLLDWIGQERYERTEVRKAHGEPPSRGIPGPT